MRAVLVVLALGAAAGGCGRELFKEARCRRYQEVIVEILGRPDTGRSAWAYCMQDLVDSAMITCVLQKYAAGEPDLCDEDE